ncbi:hypothetical protein V5O48_012945 [Marasmius crinis-equi]|uniref:F-box domain-containing protein n=1 Tax=Marasmius crinis-equi TaxID=585013 RepID=A0ABR3F1Q2_9AGAR
MGAEEPSTDADGEVWETLVQHFCRCVELTTDIFDMDAFLESIPPTHPIELSFASLTAFDAKLADFPCDTEHWFWQAIRFAPKLVRVDARFLLPTSSLPYHQLTHLKLGCLTDVYGEEFFDTLRVSENLRSITISGIGVVGGSVAVDVAIPAIELPLLQSLIIDSSIDWGPAEVHDAFLTCLLTSLEMPSLRTFQLAFTDTRGESEVLWSSALLAMLSRSSASLRRLTLRIECFRALLQPLSVLIQSTPHLTRFDLHVSGPDSPKLKSHSVDDYVASFLSALESQVTLLPKLSSMLLQFEESAHGAHTKVIDRMIKLASARVKNSPSTATGVVPLTSLRLQRLHGRSLPTFFPSQDVTEGIMALKELGVTVDIKDAQGFFSELTADEEGPEYVPELILFPGFKTY